MSMIKGKIQKKKKNWIDNTRTREQLMEINTSITRPCVVVQRKPHLYQLVQEREHTKTLVH